jgi:hypothetical protein
MGQCSIERIKMKDIAGKDPYLASCRGLELLEYPYSTSKAVFQSRRI